MILHKAQMESSKAKIRLDLEEKNIPFMKKNLRSIVSNLVTNAVKYQHPDRHPEIEIRTERSDGYIILSVKDNGIGISQHNLTKIFSKFKRVHEESNIEGTGIGLYLINRMVTNGGGKISVESEKG